MCVCTEPVTRVDTPVHARDWYCIYTQILLRVLKNVEDLKVPPQFCVWMSSFRRHAHAHTEKCVRSPSIFAICVQCVRVLMDHKGVNVTGLYEGHSAKKHFSVGLSHFGPVKFVD